jgi:hypothetical protein
VEVNLGGDRKVAIETQSGVTTTSRIQELPAISIKGSLRK